MTLDELRQLPAIARELRAAGVLQLKTPEIELSLLALPPELPTRTNEDGDTERPPAVVPPAYKAALGTFLTGGNHAEG